MYRIKWVFLFDLTLVYIKDSAEREAHLGRRRTQTYDVCSKTELDERSGEGDVEGTDVVYRHR